jgi:hypothetical protein
MRIRILILFDTKFDMDADFFLLNDADPCRSVCGSTTLITRNNQILTVLKHKLLGYFKSSEVHFGTLPYIIYQVTR